MVFKFTITCLSCCALYFLVTRLCCLAMLPIVKDQAGKVARKSSVRNSEKGLSNDVLSV